MMASHSHILNIVNSFPGYGSGGAVSSSYSVGSGQSAANKYEDASAMPGTSRQIQPPHIGGYTTQDELLEEEPLSYNSRPMPRKASNGRNAQMPRNSWGSASQHGMDEDYGVK